MSISLFLVYVPYFPLFLFSHYFTFCVGSSPDNPISRYLSAQTYSNVKSFELHPLLSFLFSLFEYRTNPPPHPTLSLACPHHRFDFPPSLRRLSLVALNGHIEAQDSVGLQVHHPTHSSVKMTVCKFNVF